MPITWRNVDGPSLADAAAPLRYAGQAFDNSFDVLGKALAQRQEAAQGVQDRSMEAAKVGYLNLLQSFKTPEALAAAQADGTIARAQAALDPRMQAQVLGKDEDRLVATRNLITQGQAYDLGQRTQAEAPMRDQIAALYATGRPEDAAAADKLIAEQTLLNEASLVQAGTESRRGAIRFGFDENQEARTAAAAAQARQLGGLQIRDQNLSIKQREQQIADAEEGRRLDTAIANARATRLADQQATGLKLGEMAATLKLPVNAAGIPRFEDFDDVQREKFDSFATKNGLPTSKQFTTGDTAFGNSLLPNLAKQGFSQRILASREDAIRRVGDTTGLNTPVGNDARNIAIGNAKNNVWADTVSKNNWYTLNDPNAATDYEQLAKEVPSLIDTTNGLATAEDVAPMQAQIAKWAVNGIDVNGVKMIPSVNDVRNAIRTAEGGWFKDGTRAKNAEKILKDSLTTERAIQIRKDAEKVDAIRNAQKLLDALKSKQ